MSRTIQGQVFVVTGAGNGIGQAVARELVGRGATVAGVDVDAAGLAQTAALTGARFTAHKLDIADRAAVADLPATILAAHDHVDGLFSIAGIAQAGMETVTGISDERIDQIMRVNFFGTLWLTRAFLPHLLARPRAVIALTASMAAIVSVPGSSIYAASKAAVAMIGEGLVHDLRRTPTVSVTTVFPGTTWTQIVRASATSMGVNENLARRVAMRPETAARRIVAATLRGARRAPIGPDAHFFSLLTRVSRRLADRLAYAQIAAHVYRD